jgi:tRNA threonylcarbamoyl adenosine modification protein YeaZ
MNYLAIDTSGKNLTVIVCKNDIVTSFCDKDCGVNHSVALMPKVEELIGKAGFDLKDADFFACVVGAGSFTGIRIGVATVKALCFAYNKPCLSITSFDTLAYNVKDGKVLAVIDAKHNGFYVCGYQDKKVILNPCYIMRDKLDEIRGEYQALVATSLIEGYDITQVSVEKGLEIAVREKAGEISEDLESLVPLYCRKSQAEEGR